MKNGFLKFILILFILFSIFGIWLFVDSKDYFEKVDYRNLSLEQRKLFEWQSGDTEASLHDRYRSHFADTAYRFPRQMVAKVNLFRNQLIIGKLTAKTLREENLEYFIIFCNDTINFTWSETTWDISESEYYIKLYGKNNKGVGEIYFCLNNCGMVKSKPFCPAMKFGGLSEIGRERIKQLIENGKNWK